MRMKIINFNIYSFLFASVVIAQWSWTRLKMKEDVGSNRVGYLQDTTSIRKKSIGKVSIRQPSVSQVRQLVKYVSWSSSI